MLHRRTAANTGTTLKKHRFRTTADGLHMPSRGFLTMRGFLATCIVTGSLLAGGCATKKYVRNTAAPIQAKVDQVGEQTTQNSQQINDTRGEVKQFDERAQSGI